MRAQVIAGEVETYAEDGDQTCTSTVFARNGEAQARALPSGGEKLHSFGTRCFSLQPSKKHKHEKLRVAVLASVEATEKKQARLNLWN